MYLLVALAITVIVIVLAWRGLDGRTDAETATPRPSQHPRRPMRQIAPDDDPDFLNEIDRRLRGEDKNGSGGAGAAG
jgi:hypothetical protein